jgi:hypothetical protein
MYDEVIEEGFGSGLCSLVSCWNSYGIPCEMVGYDKAVNITGIEKSRTTPYHPMWNGIT